MHARSTVALHEPHRAMPTTTRSCGRARSSSPICSEETRTETQEAQRHPLLNLHQVAHNQLSPPRQHPYHPRRRGGAASSPSPPAPLASPRATQPRSPQASPKHNEEEPFLCSRTTSPGRSPITALTPRGEPYSHAAQPCSATQLGLVVSLADTSLSSLASPCADLPGKDDACSDAGSVVCLYCEHGGSPLGNEILLCDGQARPRHTAWHTREHTTVAPGRRISRRRQTLNWLGERRTAAPPSSPPRPHTTVA